MRRATCRSRHQRIISPRLDALAEAGLNRASIGVQDFDPEIQKIIGRIQGFDVTAAAVV